MSQRSKYENYYGIFEIKEHDFGGRQKPLLVRGWFNDEKEANAYLDKWYHGGEKRREDNDFYGWHYTYWYEIYVFNDDMGHPYNGFYDMEDYIKDLVTNGEWDKLSPEERSILMNSAPPSAKLYLLFEGKAILQDNPGTEIDDKQQN